MKKKKKTSKNNFIIGVILISLFGLPACTNNTNNPTNNQTPSQTNTQTKQEIKVTGASTPYPVIQALATAYENKVGNVKFTFLPSSQSDAGVTGVKEGLAEIGTMTREMKSEEDDGTLKYKPVAKDGLLVATNSSVKNVTNLTTEQLKKIYSGEIRNWQELGGENEEIILLDRPEDESAKRILRKYYLGKDLKTSPDAVIHRHESDLIDSIQNTPYSIGAFSLGKSMANKIPVNALSLDGVAPTLENIKADKYAMGRVLGIVFSITPSDSVQGFIDFIDSPEGDSAIKSVNLVKVAEN